MDGLKLLLLFLDHPVLVGLTMLGLVLGMVVGSLLDAMAAGLLVGAAQVAPVVAQDRAAT